MKTITLFCVIIASNQALILPKNTEDVRNFYQIDHIEAKDQPMIQYKTDKDWFKITLPQERHDYEVLLKNEDYNDYVIVHSKRKILDIPYSLIQRLDEIKYMVLWLNIYCGMHPDCDKNKLNEELQKVVFTAKASPK